MSIENRWKARRRKSTVSLRPPVAGQSALLITRGISGVCMREDTVDAAPVRKE